MIISANAQERVPSWEELIKDQILIELNLQFVMNFSNKIFDVIIEGQQFERLGFVLSPVIRRAIMRKVSILSNEHNIYDTIIVFWWFDYLGTAL